MSEVENRARDTEVDRGTDDSQTTDEVQPISLSQTQRRDDLHSNKGGGDSAEMNLQSKDGEDDEADSEAETLRLSPEKRRSVVDNIPLLPPPDGESASRLAFPHAGGAPSNEVLSRKRKREAENGHEEDISPNPSHRSSPLSSPVAFVASVDSDSDHQSRRKGLGSDNVRGRRNGNGNQSQESEVRAGLHGVRQRRPSDIVPPQKDKHIDSVERRETRSATYSRQTDDERSPSPQPIPRREHRRGVSTQLTGQEFAPKKRGRPPLINTRRNRSAERAASVSSDDSNSPAPPRSAIAKLTGHDHDTMSPAKTGPRKWRDKNGRTFLARACNNDDLESARARLAERPEDLNLADNAGNTPLQIAALEGFVDIVRFLLGANCEVDTRNIDKETPLIDAVENGHVEVVKLLLDHGANPRLGNAKGDEPYELVPQDDENYEEIRAMLADAKERESKKHKQYEQVEAANREGESSRAASAASPRDSPPIGPRSPPAFASRRRTGRSESTRNDLLWQANTQENLTKLAAKGDVQGVASILNILQKAETESLIAAAKAGHEEVLQYLLGMGDPDPDPDPVRSLKPGHNTPMLAAIGRGHADVIKLLVSQSGFNPTRKHKDKTYYELARERKGEDWQHEVEILKIAYDNYANSKGRKAHSPRKTRDADKSKPRSSRRSSSPVSHKRMSSSPTMTHKSLSSTKSSESSPRDKRKLPEIERRKISGGRLDTGDNAVAVASDLDQTVTVAKKTHRVRRSQSDLPPPKIDSETTHRRRRLVTGKEHRRNQSTAPETDSDEDTKEVIAVKQEDKPTPTLKRTRSRSSISPTRKQSEDVDRARLGSKKRRTVLESSPDEVKSVPRSSYLLQPPDTLSSSEAPKQSIEIPKQEEVASEDTLMTNPTEAEPLLDKETDKSNTTQIPSENTLYMEHSTDKDHAKTDSDAPLELLPEPTVTDQSKFDAEQEDAERLAKEKAENDAKIESERLARLEAEKVAAEAAAAAAEAEAKAKREEEERKAVEEEQRRLAEQKEAEEAEIKRKAEEEALLRKKEEEDRRRLQYLESERQRRDTLPIVLSRCAAMIDENDGSAQSPAWLAKFLPLFTVKSRQLEPDYPSSTPDEQWVANFQVAGLLATKDLNLRNYTSFDKRECSTHERQCLWRVARNMLSFEYEANGINTSVKQAAQRENENRPKFLAMEELFWVKLSDFMDQVFRHPHLSGISLRTQPISLASYALLAQQSAQSPRINGTLPEEARLPNGIHANVIPTTSGIEQTTT